ncbi:venom serine protease 34-like [Belonocnema kinseyi]|uniref:venom serine protease 34-like n=1 Tax=Belonocnema kinseyi TaxID=2817044 RepID=UPI00143D7399|nr:venom serine protease 34-like [Belonocnema kinseyi]
MADPIFRAKNTRIVGGENTGVNEFPMMAGLVDAILVRVFCGAVIISNRYVLSAAHCVANKQAQELGVLIGDHDVSAGIDANATLLRVAGFVVHPSYVINKRNSNFDIAVIAVVGSIKFTNEIGPACLPFHHNRDSFSGAVVEILGWGTTEFAGPTSNILQKAKVSVINLSKCLNTFPNLVDSQMCTLGQGTDACQFDSGGPVLWENPTSGRLVSVGIISYGIACGTKNPSVNTRVGAFVDWILSVTPDANYCMGE